MKTKNYILIFVMLISFFSCSEETEFTITLKESGNLDVQLVQNGSPIANETIYLIPFENSYSKEIKSSLEQYSVDYQKTNSNGVVDYGEVNAGNYYLATEGVEVSDKTYYPIKIAQVISAGSKSVTMEVMDFTGTISLTIQEYDYYNYEYAPLVGANVAIISEDDYYQSYDFDDWMDKKIEDKVTNSNGEVSYTLPSGDYYIAIIYITDVYGDVYDYDAEYLTYLDQGEDYEENITVYF